MTSRGAVAFPEQDICPVPKVGIGYRRYLHNWMMEHLDLFDVAEITIDHYFWSGPKQRRQIEEISKHLPVIGHSVGLSIGTDIPLDYAYLDRVSETLQRLGARFYSEHVAFTKAPRNAELVGNELPWLDLANLVPLPKTEATIEMLAAKVEEVQRRISVPFRLENITYYFEYPDSTMDDATFFNMICKVTGARMLLDVENLYINSINHGFDAREVIDALDEDIVQEVHMAGGIDHRVDESRSDVVLIDSHDHPLREKTSELLDYLLTRQKPESIVLERDARLDEKYWPELLDDLGTIRMVVAARTAATA
jgi:uncharacterized protein (UPF0276 family)